MLVAEFDFSIFIDPPWDIGLSYGNGALWAGTANTSQYGGNEIVGRINVTPPIPEPATVLLLGTGVVGLAGFRKKFKK